LIESRLADKAELMAKIRQMSIESDERYLFKLIKSEKRKEQKIFILRKGRRVQGKIYFTKNRVIKEGFGTQER
jgi:hypothetical protein